MDQLEKKFIVNGKIKALTGLLIGGSNTAIGIGGPDKMVIRNPVTNQPYIPGSSLKGKMRSLVEVSLGAIKDVNMGQVKNGPSDDPKFISAVLFGTASQNKQQRPSRIIVRDGQLINEEVLRDLDTDLPFTESKTEVVIDRITSAAMPRTFERVPAGAEFELNIVLNLFQEDPYKDKLLNQTFSALQMVQDDYLGGSGSRGSGQIKFYVSSVLERTATYYQGNKDEEKDITNSCNMPEELN